MLYYVILYYDCNMLYYDYTCYIILYYTQGMFAVITPALMCGAFASRFRFKPYAASLARQEATRGLLSEVPETGCLESRFCKT